MIVTTTPTVEGYPVTQYLRVVCGETVAGVNFLKDMAAGFRNFVGGRSQSYEEELIQARETALAEMVQRAQELGAEGVVGVDLDYETLGTDNGMLMVTASGTAVRFSPVSCSRCSPRFSLEHLLTWSLDGEPVPHARISERYSRLLHLARQAATRSQEDFTTL